MRYVYFDNSATTELSPAAKEAMTSAMEVYGNPSSIHAAGLEAGKILSDARRDIAATLGVSFPKPGELVFTGSGSEANNLAIKGSAFAKKRRDACVVITTDSEHSSVENAMKELEDNGFKIIRISTKGGVLDFDQLESSLGEKVFMISLMMVNNETGALYDVKRAFSLVKRRYPDAITHCDAVQGYLKCKFTAQSIGADLVSISSHKVHGPKGVGALYINPAMIKAKKIVPVILGGGQESGFRSGTENLIGIAGFAAAAKEGYRSLTESTERMRSLRDGTEKALSKIDGISLNIPLGERAPHVLNVTLPSIKSETMLHFLSQRGICVSSGSACSSKSTKHSRALTAFGLSDAQADTSIRISFSASNTFEEIELLAEAISEGVASLVRIK